ncbi:hypothetical protein Tco_1162692 [Tanacetum coccineum]
MQYKKLDLSLFHVFGALCYPTNDNDDLGKLDAKADIGIFVGYAPAKKAFRIYNKRTRKIIETIHMTFDELTVMASEQFSLGPRLHSLTPTTSSSGLVTNPVSQQPCIPPPRDDWDRLFQPMFNEYFTPPSIVVTPFRTRALFYDPTTSSSGLVSNPVSQRPCIPPKRDDWDHLFQPMFDEYFNPPSIVVTPIQEAAAPKAVVLTDSLVSTSIDQDVPSTQKQELSPNISQGFRESPKTPTFRDDPLYEFLHEESTSQGSSSNVRQIHTPFEYIGKWTKDLPIRNVIGDLSRSVSTRKQLQTDAM